MLIKFTYVDAITKVSMMDAPCANGPVLPAMPGIAIDFTNESQWPCDAPVFYGHCDDGSDLCDGVIDVVTQETFDGAFASEMARRAVIVRARVVRETQHRLDAFAQTRSYDGILSACTYASSTVPQFAADGQYAVNARDQTWATLYSIMGEVQAGTRPMPSGYADIEADLPVLSWPA